MNVCFSLWVEIIRQACIFFGEQHLNVWECGQLWIEGVEVALILINIPTIIFEHSYHYIWAVNSKYAGRPVLTVRFVLGPASADHLPVQMTGGKNAHSWLVSLRNIKEWTGVICVGPRLWGTSNRNMQQCMILRRSFQRCIMYRKCLPWLL